MKDDKPTYYLIMPQAMGDGKHVITLFDENLDEILAIIANRPSQCNTAMSLYLKAHNIKTEWHPEYQAALDENEMHFEKENQYVVTEKTDSKEYRVYINPNEV